MSLENITYKEAIELLTKAVGEMGTETVFLEESFGRILAETVCSDCDVPPFDRSPYDGYAVRSQDVREADAGHPVTLEIIDVIPAGKTAKAVITSGKAAKIMTGAPIPSGADAVVMFEKTEFTEDTVTLFSPIKPGENIIYAGEDVRAGDVLAGQGSRIDAGLMGTLASQNKTRIKVYQRPVVGLISTGSELVPVGCDRKPWQIHDSNRYTLTGACMNLGCVCNSYGIAGDSVDEIANLIEKALGECDLVVITGGVSVGDYDLTPEAMTKAGVTLLFQRCDIKPGMACAYGQKDGKLVCGLSGNPASSITNFMLLAKPAVQKLMGMTDYMHREIALELASDFPKKSRVTRILRGQLLLEDGVAKMSLSREQGNVVLSSTIGWNVMAIVPAGSPKLEAGSKLRGILLNV